VKLLITGATGFVGSHLVCHLARSTHYDVAVLRRRSSRHRFPTDVEQRLETHILDDGAANILDILAACRPDVVVHLATCFLSSHTMERIDDLVQANITFPTKLLEAMAAHGVRRFINTGTYAEHFNCNPDYDPVTLYAATKKAFEDILRYYVNAVHLSHIKVTLYDTYGPDDTRRKILNILLDAVRQGQKIDMTPGHQLMDLVHIDDVVRAFELATDYISTHDRVDSAVEIGSGSPRTLREIVGVVEGILGRSIDVNWGGRAYRERDNMTVKPDLSLAKTLLGWEPQTSLEEGLKPIIAQEIKA